MNAQVVIVTRRIVTVPNDDVVNRRNWGRTIRDIYDWHIEPEMKRQGKSNFGAALIEMSEDQPVKVDLSPLLSLETKEPILAEDQVGKEVPINLRDIADIRWGEAGEDSNLTSDPNTAKILIIRFSESHWILNFDLRYNQQKTKQRFERAREFMLSVNEQQPHVAVYLLWSVAELLVDCHLLLMAKHQEALAAPGSKHTARLNAASSLSSNSELIPSTLVETLEKLSRLKNNARYGAIITTSELTIEKIVTWRTTLQAELDSFAKRIE